MLHALSQRIPGVMRRLVLVAAKSSLQDLGDPGKSNWDLRGRPMFLTEIHLACELDRRKVPLVRALSFDIWVPHLRHHGLLRLLLLVSLDALLFFQCLRMVCAFEISSSLITD